MLVRPSKPPQDSATGWRNHSNDSLVINCLPIVRFFLSFLPSPSAETDDLRMSVEIVRELDPDDPSVEPLLQIGPVLADICSMTPDSDTVKTAIMWLLARSIDGFPVCFFICISHDTFN